MFLNLFFTLGFTDGSSCSCFPSIPFPAHLTHVQSSAEWYSTSVEWIFVTSTMIYTILQHQWIEGQSEQRYVL